MTPQKRRRLFVAILALLLAGYAVIATAAWNGRSWSARGPLSYTAPALTSGDRDRIGAACRARPDDLESTGDAVRLKIVGGAVDGTQYLACYGQDDGGGVTGVVVLTAAGLTPVSGKGILQAGGAWPWRAAVGSSAELVFAGVTLALLGAAYLRYYWRRRPAAPNGPWWSGRWADAILIASGIGVLAIWLLPGRDRPRKAHLTLRTVLVWTAFALVVVDVNTLAVADPVSLTVAGFLTITQLFCWLGGRSLVRPRDVAASTPPSAVEQCGAWPVQTPAALPTFAQVGGMEELKAELRQTLGTTLAHGSTARAYGIRFNGILLHGRPGTGKTLLAKAIAGEFGLNFLPVTAGSVLSKYAGESARAIDEAFAAAVAHAPCVLFFDEFDSLASRRDGEPDSEHRRVVNQLLTALEQHHAGDHVIVVAATNDLTRLDPAVTRPGRFDRTIRIDLPDIPARRAILATALHGRPFSPAVDLAGLADRTAGRSAAELAALVDLAARAAFSEHTEAASGDGVSPVLIDDRHLSAALAAHAGQDRPYLGDHHWEDLVLPATLLEELRAVQKLIENPELAAGFGVRPLSGLLLAGPPGTGKTSVARTLAAQARVSFYPLSTADLTSPWVGQAEQRLAQLFERARAGAPSVVFIDEIDAIAADRDSMGGFLGDRLLTQLLAELDGIASTARPVFVLAATNRPDVLDPALVRGGRLSRTLRLPLPDREARLRLLTLHSREVPLGPDVDLAALAGATSGHSGADLATLLQQAALQAMVRHDGSGPPLVAQQDLLAALPRTAARH